jgi:hypothetical protein
LKTQLNKPKIKIGQDNDNLREPKIRKRPTPPSLSRSPANKILAPVGAST